MTRSVATNRMVYAARSIAQQVAVSSFREPAVFRLGGGTASLAAIRSI